MPVKAPSSVMDFPGHLWTMCHHFPTTLISVPVLYMSHIRSIYWLEALTLLNLLRLNRIRRFQARRCLRSVILYLLVSNCLSSLSPTASSVSVLSPEDKSVNTVSFVSLVSLMETTTVVWGTPAVVFRVLIVRLVTPLAGYLSIMVRRRFLGFLFPFLSLL